MLSIIFVYYHTRFFLQKCIESIIENETDFKFEIIVSDNGSASDDKDFFLKLFPSIVWIDMMGNYGFARGNNAAMKVANGDCYLLLNTDTLLENNAISICYTRLNHDKSLVAAGLNLKFDDGAPQISGSYFVAGGLNYLLPLPVTGFVIKRLSKLIGKKAPHVINRAESVNVDWISGAFLMVKKSAVLSAGFMDEDFFLYAEETEWCYRLGRVGNLVLFGDLSVIHYEGFSSKLEHNDQERGYYELHTKRGFQLMVSNILRIRKQYGLIWYLFILIFYSLEVVWSFIISFIFLLTGSSEKLKRWYGFSLNIIQLVRLMPKMISGTPYFYKMI